MITILITFKSHLQALWQTMISLYLFHSLYTILHSNVRHNIYTVLISILYQQAASWSSKSEYQSILYVHSIRCHSTEETLWSPLWSKISILWDKNKATFPSVRVINTCVLPPPLKDNQTFFCWVILGYFLSNF